MTTAQQLLDLALSYRGVTENPAGSNCQPFSQYLGRPCHFWCADYTAAIMRMSATPIPPGADTASTRANKAAWIKAGRWVTPDKLQPGDVLFFHISGRNGNDPNVPDHTGFCITGEGSIIHTVEGNTSSDDHGSQDNGGGVFERTRRRGVVIGAGRPAYTTAPHPPTEEDMNLLVQVEDGDHAQRWFLLAGGCRRAILDDPTLAEIRQTPGVHEWGKVSQRYLDSGWPPREPGRDD